MSMTNVNDGNNAFFSHASKVTVQSLWAAPGNPRAVGPDRSCWQFFRQNIEELKDRKLPAKSEQNIEMLGEIDA